MKRLIYKTLIYCILALSSISFLGCNKDLQKTLSVNLSNIEFQNNGGSASFTINTDADAWNIDNPAADWLILSSTSGTDKTANITISVTSRCLEPRSATITINAGNASPVEIMVSQASSEYLFAINIDYSSLTFIKAGNSALIGLSTDVEKWNLTTDVDWLLISQKTGNSGYNSIFIVAKENTGSTARSATITITGENAETLQIPVLQKGDLYPNYNIAQIADDATGMSNNAVELAAKINLGWNIGNTLEAIGGETAWGNPKITNEYVKFVKQCGFNAIRLPCSWNQNSDQTTAKINDAWLNRVKEVVQYCVDNNLYVLLNIHWDGGWLENNCTESKQEENNAKQKAFWQQIATHLRDFDEHLMFASANEPNVSGAAQMSILLSYHQTFIDAVRSTGGRNAYRVLVVQGPNTDIDATNKLMNQMPTDKIADRLIAEIHYYTPWNFTGMTKDETWGNMFYYWGRDNHSTTDLNHNPTWGEEADVDNLFSLMKTKFIDKGIPVIMGEYGASLRTNLSGQALELHKKSRAYYFQYVTHQAKAYGILPFFWDTGGILNRNNNSVIDQLSLDGIIQGGIAK